MVKVRFAPSPTGIPHIGGTRTALFNFLFAKSQNGEFILRIEDTDQKRLVKGSEDAILEILEWLGLEHDGEVIHQSERLKIYKEYVNKLVSQKLAYEKDGAAWVNVPDDKSFEWTDLVGNKKISFKGKDVEDFVILKSDGFPTYHLANAIDDHLTGITHVLRGEEWTPSTPKHIYLYGIFGWELPFFAHLPVILGADHAKLSKRHGAESALDYKGKGFLKESLLNFMALLGWNPGGDKEIMSIDEMIKLFKLSDVNTANPIFDIKKLEWLNGVWIRSLEKTDIKERLLDFYKEEKDIQKALGNDQILDASLSRMKTLSEFKSLISGEKSRAKTKEEKEIAIKLQTFLESSLKDKWEDEDLLSSIRQFSKQENIPFKTIYFLLSGREHGIGILELNKIYGKQFLLDNLRS